MKINFYKINLKNQFGFSLLAVMVLLFIIGLSVVTSLKLFSIQLTSASTIEGRYELNALRDSISEIFFDTESCKASLLGINPNSGSINDIMVRRISTDVAVNVYTVSPSIRYNRIIEIKSFSLDSGGVTISANSKAVTEFVITGSVARETYGSEDIERKIILEIETDSSGNISSCGVSLANRRRDILQYICSTLGGDFVNNLEACQHLTLYADIPGTAGALNLVPTVSISTFTKDPNNTILQEVAKYTCLTLGGSFNKMGKGGLGDCKELHVIGEVEVLNESATPGSLVIKNSGEILVQ